MRYDALGPRIPQVVRRGGGAARGTALLVIQGNLELNPAHIEASLSWKLLVTS